MRPNIIVFMTDHQRGDTILENSQVLTPNIDKFRNKSIIFKNAYCPSPHCCPSRASFFSGLYPSEHGVWNNVNVSNAHSFGLFDDVRLFSEDLKKSGYDMYFSGKWHVSAEKGPQDYGFENIFHKHQYKKHINVPDIREWKTYESENVLLDTQNEVKEEARIIRPGYTKYIQYGIDENPFDDKEVVEAAVNKIKEIDGENPFFLYVGTLGPHDPYFVPQRFLDLYDIADIKLPESFYDDMNDKPSLYKRTKNTYSQLTEDEHKESIRRFYAFCTYEDYLFGSIMDELNSKKYAENTLVMYLSDHGDYVGSHGLWAKGLPCFREAYDICGLVGGDIVINPNRVIEDFVSLVDFAPTFLELANIKIGEKMKGTSLVSYIRNEQVENKRQYCFSQSNGNEVYGIQRSVWNKFWKYTFNSFDFDELYDLESDPHELTNLLHGIENINLSKYNKIVKDMCFQLWTFAYENKDNCVNSYIMTGFAPFGPGIIF